MAENNRYKQFQEKDPRKMWENLKAGGEQIPNQPVVPVHQNPIGGGYTVTPGNNLDAETEAQIAAGQQSNLQRAQQDPAFQVKLQAMRQLVEKQNQDPEARLRNLKQRGPEDFPPEQPDEQEDDSSVVRESDLIRRLSGR